MAWDDLTQRPRLNNSTSATQTMASHPRPIGSFAWEFTLSGRTTCHDNVIANHRYRSVQLEPDNRSNNLSETLISVHFSALHNLIDRANENCHQIIFWIIEFILSDHLFNRSKHWCKEGVSERMTWEAREVSAGNGSAKPKKLAPNNA